MEELTPSSPPTPAPAASPEKLGKLPRRQLAPADLEQPPEKPGETNAPTTSVRPESADFAKEQQKKLRGMVEDAFRKAEQAHDQGTNQTNQTNQP